MNINSCKQFTQRREKDREPSRIPVKRILKVLKKKHDKKKNETVCCTKYSEEFIYPLSLSKQENVATAVQQL